MNAHYTYEAFLAASSDNSCSLAVVFSGIKQESKNVKIQQSRNKPGVAQRVPGGVGSQFHDIRHMKVVRSSAPRTGRRKCSWYSFSLS
jgi:hypothetical protein